MMYRISFMKGIGIAAMISSVVSESNVGRIVLLIFGLIVYSIYDWVALSDLEEISAKEEESEK